MIIDFSSLDKAIHSLERGIVRATANPDDEELRDAVIQRFEYTYELCWKMLKRKLEADSPNPAVIDSLSFRDMLREAAEKGILQNIESWFEYREQRNITSHTYDEDKAISVYNTAVRFLEDAKQLLATLTSRAK